MNKKVVLSVLSATFVASMAASAFAAPNNGLYIGGNVKTHYSFETLIGLDDAGMAKFKADMAAIGTDFNNLVYVSLDKKGASIAEILAAPSLEEANKDPLKKEDFADVYSEIDKSGNVTGTYDARKDVDGTTPGELTVESVSAINAKEIVVDFNQDVDPVTAEDAANYTLVVNNASTPLTATTHYTVALDADDASKAVITLVDAQALQNGDKLSVVVEKTILNKDLSPLGEDFTSVSNFEDAAAPTVTEVEVDGNDLKVSFNEFITSVGLVKVDGVALNSTDLGTINTALGTAASKTITLAGKASGLTAGNHTVSVGNVTDLQSPTPNTTSFASKTFTITEDNAAPAVEGSLAVVSQNQFKITFDKEVTQPTVTVKKNGYALNASLTSGPDDEYTVTVTDATPVKLYETGESTANLSVTVSGYKASSNNLFGTTYTGTVTLSKDSQAPAVSSSVARIFDFDATGGVDERFYVQFNEVIQNPVTSKIVLKDKDGIRQTVTDADLVADANGKNTILAVQSTAVQATGVVNPGNYTIELAAGAVEDAAGNDNAVGSVTASKAAAANTIDLDPNASDNGSGNTNPNDVVASGNTITINYGVDMTTSATTKANYTIDGAALPANSLVYFDGSKQVVTIELPAGTIADASDIAFGISQNVVSEDGEKVKAEDLSMILTGLTDNVQPVLKSAKLLNAGVAATTTFDQIELTFSEGIASFTDNLASQDDFIVEIAGVEVPVAAFASNTDGDETVVLTFASGAVYNTAQTVTVTVAADNIVLTDALTNPLTANTTVTATK